MATTSMGIRHATNAKPNRSRGLRPDIQGLRALAVLAVIADHTFGYPRGGFVGVDVFFVISGFLITGLLLREHERAGHISFADFYRKRARRILPLAVLVLVVTVAASWVVFSAGRAMKITEDGLWSLVFGTNWHLALIGTDYMQAGAAVSPLQHFWSLAVEEQFYVVWPWLIVLVLGTALNVGWSQGKARLVLTVAMVTLTVAAFTFATWETANNPTVAYFSTFSRAWELGIGAVLAASVGALAKLPQVVRPVLAYAGLAGIVWSVFAISPEMAFPAPWAAVPVIATAMVIGAGAGSEARFLFPLTNRVFRYIGDISYSLYLWHFPVITIAGSLLSPEDPAVAGLMLIGIFALSMLSYHFIEDPVRKSAWLEPARRLGRPRRRKVSISTRFQVGLLLALGFTTAVVVTVALMPRTVPAPTASALTSETPSTVSPRASSTFASGPVGDLAGLISSAASATDWPELTPSLDSLPGAYAPEWKDDDCLNVDDSNLHRCVYGDSNAGKVAILLGDSVAISWMPGLRDALNPQDWKIQVATMGQCPAVDIPVNKGNGPDPKFTQECSDHQKWAMDLVAKSEPDMVIVASALNSPWRTVGADSNPNVLADWTKATIARLQELKTKTKAQIVLLSSPAETENLPTCATKFSHPADCFRKKPRYADYLASEKAAADAVEGVRYVSPHDWFCTKDEQCPAFAGNTPIYVEANHLTPAFSKKLAPVLGPAVLGSP